MNWQKLIEIESEYLAVGTLLRFPPCDFFAGERVIEIMMCSAFSAEEAFVFIVTSGFESGKKLGYVPINAASKDSCHQLSKHWLLDNWYKYIYPESNLADVYVGRRKALTDLQIDSWNKMI